MKPYELPQHIIDLANEYDESKHPRAENDQWTSGAGGAGGASEETKGKLQKMLKHEAVSVAAGGNPATAGKDAIHFEYRGKRYYVGKDNEHMVKQFEEAGLVKRIGGGGGYARKDEETASKYLGGALKNYKGDRSSQAEWLNQRLQSNRAGKKDAGTSRAGKEMHYQRIRGVHVAAILSGLKYNRATHQYE